MMVESEDKLRVPLVTFFPMLIAALSLITSTFNGYLNNNFVDLTQRNIGRAEYMRTCKETIEAYFQVKFKAAFVSANGAQARAGTAATSSAERIDTEAAVNKFAALGTDLRDETIRARYTELVRALEKVVADASGTPPTELGQLFEGPDRIFAELNNNCRQHLRLREIVKGMATHRP